MQACLIFDFFWRRRSRLKRLPVAVINIVICAGAFLVAGHEMASFKTDAQIAASSSADICGVTCVLVLSPRILLMWCKGMGQQLTCRIGSFDACSFACIALPCVCMMLLPFLIVEADHRITLGLELLADPGSDRWGFRLALGLGLLQMSANWCPGRRRLYFDSVAVPHICLNAGAFAFKAYSQELGPT